VPGGATAIARARAQLNRLDQVALTPRVLDAAATLAPATRLRNLDAIHLAAAQLAGSQLQSVVTYDVRMLDVARDLGLPVESPI
jgi:predicted nucleic acid-binding protein